MTAELEYWDAAALDPQVDDKYICNLSTEECLEALGELPAPRLEIGCGVGRLMQDGDCGVDLSREMLAIAKARRPKAHFFLGMGKDLPLPDRQFNSVYSMLVFQHCDAETVSSYFKEAYRVLKSGGIFRFQVVLGQHHDFIDHGYSQDIVLHMLDDAGFAIEEVDISLMHPQWAWFTGVKE